MSIEVNDNYYEPINDKFDFKISEKSYYICNPIAFDSEYNRLNYYTTHTLTNNEDGSYRYTKYLKPESSLNVNTAQYLDADLALNQSASGRFMNELRYVPSALFLTSMRDAVSTSINGSNVGNTVVAVACCGDQRTKTVSTPINGPSTTTNKWRRYQTHFIFNTSGIGETVTSATLKQRGFVTDNRNIGNGSGTSSNTDISVIALKSTWDGSDSKVSSVYPQFNDFTGHTSGWDDTDVTEYSGEAVWPATSGTSQDQDITLNSDAKTDMENDSTFKIVVIDYDEFYLDSFDSSYAIPSSANNIHARITTTFAYNYIGTSYRPYIEYSTGTVSTPTENAVFFGTNF